MKDSFYNIFNEINFLHIAFITSISVFFKEFIYFLFEYFEDFKLKDLIGKSNKGNITEDIPSILNQDNGSSNKPGYSGSGAQASGSGTQASGSGAQASGSGTQASGSGTQAADPEGRSIADDYRNYQWDSDSDYDNWKDEDDTRSESNEEDYNNALGDDSAKFGEKVAQMDDADTIRSIKNVFSTAIQIYESTPHVPAAKAQIPELEEKIAMCESRLSELEAEKEAQSKDKGKGKANE